MRIQIKILKLWLLGVMISAWAVSSSAAELTLATGPLYLGTNVDPNVFFELDDSGSMDWETLTGVFDYYSTYWRDTSESKITSGRWRSYASVGAHHAGSRKDYVYLYHEDDSLYYNSNSFANAEQNPESLQRDWRARSSDFNLIYYDPEVTYRPWAGLPDAVFTAARSDPQTGTSGYSSTRNLSGFIFEVFTDDHGYAGSKPDGPDDATDGANGIVDLWDSRIEYRINAADWLADDFSVPSSADMAALGTTCSLSSAQLWHAYQDCFGTVRVQTGYGSGDINPFGRTLVEEQLNVANWYQYYRKRAYIAKSAISSVVTESPDFRYGISVINNHSSLFVEVPAAGINNYGASNAALLQNLYSFNWPALGTPLRKGLERAGQYFDNALSGKVDPIISECQQNFSILLTDGYWNQGAPSWSIGDEDGDGNSSVTVADVAKYYYDKDLSPFSNNVSTSVVDPNNRQHMVTFTVAFGVKGDLVDTDNDGYPNPELAENGNWGYPTQNTDNASKIDDLWHAAFNSKGEYIAAQTPEEVVSSLNSALSEITDRVGSSAAVATNSGSLNSGSHLFQARFDSGGWSGELIAYALNSDGTINPTRSWEAGEVLDTQNYDTDRVILTFNPDIDVVPGGAVEGDGIAFRFPTDYTAADAGTELSSDQILTLLSSAPYFGSVDPTEIAINQVYGEKIVNYFRGDRSLEGVGSYNFRHRNSALGDIVDSDPQYVSAPRARYPDAMESRSYLAFRSAYADRDSMVYVGANDGMLHGFIEEDGSEKLAYIPNAVFSKIGDLADPFYSHQYFVNEAPVVVDAFFDETPNPLDDIDGVWRSVLVGGLGSGGQSMYALDVTDPNHFSEDEENAADIALWEFDDVDLGYTYGAPSIAKMANGSWAAVFGNGYNNSTADGSASTNGHAWLYIVDIDNGDIIKKIDTGVGSVATPNGLSSPTLIDVDGDFVVDIIYGGDLEGNMWKFDVSSEDSADWDISFEDAGTPKPLFTTFNNQPITTRPQVSFHPDNNDGYMVFFGSGKYIEQSDNSPAGADTQSFYGIWDKDDGVLPVINSSNLLQQSITDQYALDFDTDDDGDDDLFRQVRTVSSNTIDFNNHRGWYMNLKPVLVNGSINTNNFGEKQVSNSVLRDGKIIFTTLIPSQDLCDFGGSSYIMELDYRDGGLIEYPVFDINGDEIFDDSDASISGLQSDVGIASEVSIVVDTVNGVENNYYSGSGGGIGRSPTNPGAQALGRQSWRQLK